MVYVNKQCYLNCNDVVGQNVDWAVLHEAERIKVNLSQPLKHTYICTYQHKCKL